MIGQRLRLLRKNKDISQEELAKILDVTTSSVGLYETDARNPSFDVLIKIAKYFSVTTDYILGITDNMNENINVPKDYALLLSSALEKGVTSEQLKAIISLVKLIKDG